MTSDDIVRTLMPKRSHIFRLDAAGISEAYIRKGMRIRAGLALRTLDVANVFVAERERRKGLFSSMLAATEEAAPRLGADAVYVECVLGWIVAEALERRGYTRFQTGSQVDYLKLVTPQ